MKQPEFIALYNDVSFDNRYYDSEKYLSKKARLLARHIDTRQNNSIKVKIRETSI